MSKSRRQFLKTSACGLTGAAMLASLNKLNLVNAMTQQQPDAAADYKALVCIFLSGGSDCNNMVIPFDDFASYNTVRGGSGLGLLQSQIQNTKITPSNTSGVSYAFHPNLSPEANNAAVAPGLLKPWTDGKLAVLCNVGSLVRPITRANYIANIGRP